MTEEHPYKTPKSSINRLKNRGVYDYATIHSLIDASPVLHVSFNAPSADEPFPVILPMLGATGVYPPPASPSPSGARSIYLHGHAASRLMKSPPTAATAEEISDGAEIEGMACCVAATFVDGLVLSYTPFHNSCNYRSAVVFGQAFRVTDEAERHYAMTLITDNLLPRRWEHSREPSSAEFLSTGILRVDVHAASAKLRTGTSHEERKDLKDDALRERTWVGTIPVAQRWGEPVPSPDNRVKGVPAYIGEYLEKENSAAKRYAEEAIQEEKTK